MISNKQRCVDKLLSKQSGVLRKNVLGLSSVMLLDVLRLRLLHVREQCLRYVIVGQILNGI
jgi:hypothetical protein